LPLSPTFLLLPRFDRFPLNFFLYVHHVKADHYNKKPELVAALVHFAFDVSRTQEFYMKLIGCMDFPQHGEVFYFYGQALHAPSLDGTF
jgi:hypothetical protein